MENTLVTDLAIIGHKKSFPDQELDIERASYKEFFIEELGVLYSIEHQLINFLPTLIRNADSNQLAYVLKDQLKHTIVNIARLDIIFDLLGSNLVAERARIASEKRNETHTIIRELEAGMKTVPGKILAIRKVKVFKINTYSSLADLAKELGREREHEILQQTLMNEKEADQLLADIVNDC